jgi:hypothetical protein
MPAFVRRLVVRRLVFDADTVGDGVGTGHLSTPFYLREAYAAQAVAVILQGAKRLVFLQANTDCRSGLQKMAALKTHTAVTVVQYLCVIAVYLVEMGKCNQCIAGAASESSFL